MTFSNSQRDSISTASLGLVFGWSPLAAVCGLHTHPGVLGATSYPCGFLRDSRFCNLIARPDKHRTDDHFGFDFWDGHSWRPFVTYFRVTFKGPFEIIGCNDSGTNGIISTETVKSSTRDQFPVIQEGKKLIQDLKPFCFLTDGLMILTTWDHRMITDPFVKGGLNAEGIGVREGRRIRFVTAVDPWQHRRLLLDTNRRTEKDSIQVEMETNARCRKLV